MNNWRAVLTVLTAVVCLTTSSSNVTQSDNADTTEAISETTTPVKPVYRLPTREELGVTVGDRCIAVTGMLNPPMHARDRGCLCLLLFCGRPLTKEEEKLRHIIIKERIAKLLPIRAKKYAVHIALQSFSGLVGIPGNALVLATLAFYMERSSVTNVLIASLTVSDLLTLLITLPLSIRDILTYYWLGTSNAEAHFCSLYNFLFNFSYTCSLLTMGAMSIERYIVVCHPMKAHMISSTPRARIVAAVLWLVAALATLPMWFLSKATDSFLCNLFIGNTLGDFYSYFLPVAIYCLPLLVMTICYGRVSITLFQSIKITKGLQNKGGVKDDGKESEDIKGRIQIVKMLIIILVSFAVLWGPQVFFFVLIKHDSPDVHTRNSFMDLAFLSCAINPLLYPIFSKQFREGFRRALTCTRPKPKQLGVSRVTASTSVSASVDKRP